MGVDSGSDISSDETSIRNKFVQYEPTIKVDKKLHKCNYPNCNKIFSRPSKLRRHSCTHTGEKFFACKYANCTKKYSYEWHLKRHVNTVHEKPLYTQSILCPYEGCVKELSSDWSLRRHVKLLHSENKISNSKYVCTHCSQKFRKKSQLATHMQSHTPTSELKCSKCSLSFLHLNDLKKHLSNHKTYTCECGETFYRWTVFVSHKKNQHPKSYTCKICSRIFHSKKYLKDHEQVHTDQRILYQCEYDGCPRYYHYSRNLVHHIKSFHETQRYMCTFDNCERSFVTKQKQQQHLKTHDPNWVRRKNVRNKRKTRKDAGIPKKEMALHLAGIPNGLDINSLKDDLAPEKESEYYSNKTQLDTKCVNGVLNIVSTTV